MKGWIQTWLVHMRDPLRLCRELGLRGFFGFQIVIFGLIASALAHPVFLLSLGWMSYVLASTDTPDFWLSLRLAVDVSIMVVSYTGFALLAYRALGTAERIVLAGRLWTIPAYWLLVSVATLRAVRQIASEPHKWEKTPHGVRPAPAPPPRRLSRYFAGLVRIPVDRCGRVGE